MSVSASDLLNFAIHDGKISEAGLRQNIKVALVYLESWLRSVGAVAIDNLMEDAATAEISRAQIWQLLHNPQAKLEDGRAITPELYRTLSDQEYENIRQRLGPEIFAKGKYAQAKEIIDHLVLEHQFEEFLTLIAYSKLEE